MSDCCAWKLRWQLPPAIGSMRMRSRLPSGPFVPVMTGAAMGQSRLLKGLKLVPEAQTRVGQYQGALRSAIGIAPLLCMAASLGLKLGEVPLARGQSRPAGA